jgi:hypothetical protein
MTQQHPITPPLELVREWLCSEDYPWGPLEQQSITITTNRLQNVATKAARWGAAQELEACAEWLAYEGHEHEHLALRSARRPKPSLKEQALEAQRRMWSGASNHDDWDLVRRALEQLPD